jgi:hypothetical protein
MATGGIQGLLAQKVQRWILEGGTARKLNNLARDGIYDVQIQKVWRGYNGMWGSNHSHLVPGFTNFNNGGEFSPLLSK